MMRKNMSTNFFFLNGICVCFQKYVFFSYYIKNNLLVKISILNKFFDQNFKLFNRDIICRILIKADVLDHSQLFIDCNFMRVSENIIALQSTKQYTNVAAMCFFFRVMPTATGIHVNRRFKLFTWI